MPITRVENAYRHTSDFARVTTPSFRLVTSLAMRHCRRVTECRRTFGLSHARKPGALSIDILESTASRSRGLFTRKSHHSTCTEPQAAPVNELNEFAF